MQFRKMGAMPGCFAMGIATVVGGVFVLGARPSVNAGVLFLAEDSEHNWLVIGGVIVVFIVSSLFGIYGARMRANKIEALARSLGYTFRGRAIAADSDLVMGCYLGDTGSKPTVSNVMEVARTPELKFVVFDFEYTTDDGETSITVRQTIARIQTPLLKLPSFFLFPETIASKIKVLFGGEDVNFPICRNSATNTSCAVRTKLRSGQFSPLRCARLWNRFIP
jgi:hypothetical protein